MAKATDGKVKLLLLRSDKRYYTMTGHMDGLHFLRTEGRRLESQTLRSLFLSPVFSVGKGVPRYESWEDGQKATYPDIPAKPSEYIGVYPDDDFFCVPPQDPKTFILNPVAVQKHLKSGYEEKFGQARGKASRADVMANITYWMVMCGVGMSVFLCLILLFFTLPMILSNVDIGL